MNLSLNFVKDYIDLDNELSVKDIAEAMTKAGNEYDSAEKLVNATKLVIGEIKCIQIQTICTFAKLI